MRKIVVISVFVLILLLVFNADAFAQCAMCRATAEDVSQNVDKGIGEGLNSGIVYLMMLPYILLATVALVFFRKKIIALFQPGHA